jgi:hypothetical protein
MTAAWSISKHSVGHISLRSSLDVTLHVYDRKTTDGRVNQVPREQQRHVSKPAWTSSEVLSRNVGLKTSSLFRFQS